jgi:hypothetical protein
MSLQLPNELYLWANLVSYLPPPLQIFGSCSILFLFDECFRNLSYSLRVCLMEGFRGGLCQNFGSLKQLMCISIKIPFTQNNGFVLGLFFCYCYSIYALCIENWEFVKQLMITLRVFWYKYTSIKWFLNLCAKTLNYPRYGMNE